MTIFGFKFDTAGTGTRARITASWIRATGSGRIDPTIPPKQVPRLLSFGFDVAWGIQFRPAESYPEGLPYTLPQHVSGSVLVPVESPGDDGRAHFRLHQSPSQLRA